MKKQRKHYTPEEKIAILRRHLLEQVPISELCDKRGLQTTVFYRWQKQFFDHLRGAAYWRVPSLRSVVLRAARELVAPRTRCDERFAERSLFSRRRALRNGHWAPPVSGQHS